MADDTIPSTPTPNGVDAPPATTTFTPVEAASEPSVGTTPPRTGGDAKRVFESGAASLRDQAQERVREFAEEGKARIGDALEQVADMLKDAAGQVDERLGASYGDHARNAAMSVEAFASSVRDKDIDEAAADVRGFIARSPAAAVGVTAALGFALARVVHAGLDQRD